jgi:Dolichyl-phosphate-mannose-protein mannosyltransferase
MGVVSYLAGVNARLGKPGTAGQVPQARSRLARWLEALAVALSPLTAALVLRLRLMAPSVLADPAMHSAYITDPHDMLTRYGAYYAIRGRLLRESARAGFLVPARLAYLAFGAVPGFFVTRYVFALVAVVPVYLLLRRLYGRPAGVIGILAVLSSPVLVTAWGTDYPDSAVVSYAAGALACLAMPCATRWRRAWLAAAGVLLTLAVWSHGVALPLAAATMAAYLGVRLLRDRARVAGDLAVLAGVAVAVTGLLVAASALLLGHANFIAATWDGIRFLSTSSQTALWHSANWRWASYVPYLLVPPAVLAAYVVAVARRGRAVPTPVLLVGIVTAAQLAVYTVLQFAGSVQILEQHYFSSSLWGAVCVVFAVTIAELAWPLRGHRFSRWLPAAVLLAVPLGYEAAPRVPPFGWLPAGAVVACAAVVAAAAVRRCARLRSPVVAGGAASLALATLAGAVLILTVAPIPQHPQLPGTVNRNVDPAPAYASALGGGWGTYLDSYRIDAALPGFVGQAAYPSETLLVWRMASADYVKYAGAIYRATTNTLPRLTPVVTASDRRKLQSRRPAELLFLGTSPRLFPAALRHLAAFQPTRVRAGKLRSGSLTLYVWLLRLGVYAPHSGG